MKCTDCANHMKNKTKHNVADDIMMPEDEYPIWCTIFLAAVHKNAQYINGNEAEKCPNFKKGDDK